MSISRRGQEALGLACLACGCVSLYLDPLALIALPLGVGVTLLARRDLARMKAGLGALLALAVAPLAVAGLWAGF